MEMLWISVSSHDLSVKNECQIFNEIGHGLTHFILFHLLVSHVHPSSCSLNQIRSCIHHLYHCQLLLHVVVSSLRFDKLPVGIQVKVPALLNIMLSHSCMLGKTSQQSLQASRFHIWKVCACACEAFMCMFIFSKKSILQIWLKVF
jgi:hypothetical protein